MVASLLAIGLQAQVTTSAIGGQVTDNEDLPAVGVAVKATHLTSGTVYRAVTNAKGRYTIQGLRPGGPYTIEFNYLGYAPARLDDIYLELGNEYPLDTKLALQETNLGEAVVVAMRRASAGSGENFSLERIQTSPTINRDVYDIVTTSPMVMSSKIGGISIVGSNNRYNSFQIDGVVANDVFGLSAGGTNGAQTGANPVSLDAIEEVQVVVAPYDVRHGGFTGGGINAVTKSGTNQLHGSAYAYFNNQNMYGRYSVLQNYAKNPLTDQFDRTFGGTLGGAFVKDRLFYFFSVENKKKSYPSSLWPGFDDKYITTEVAQQIADKYYEMTGIRETFGRHDVDSHSLGILGRLDWNIDERNKLTLRYQFNNSYKDAYSLGSTSYTFERSAYRYNNLTHSIVLELNSHISDKVSNELRVSGSWIRDHRDVPYHGPNAQITNVNGADGTRRITVNIGTDYSSGANILDQNTYSFEDNLSVYLGNHTLTFGTHNEIFKIRNLFIQAAYGAWYFNSLDNFLNDNPYQFKYNYTDPTYTKGDVLFAPNMGAGQFGLYAQDKWNVTRDFNVTYGLRIDIPTLFNRPMKNQEFNAYAAEQGFDVRVGENPKAHVMFSPRLGFNWYLNKKHSVLLRGGTGIFTGRVPFVWLSNTFNNTGVEKKGTTISRNVPGMSDYQNALQEVIDAGSNSLKPDIVTVSRDFKYPQVFRSNLALEATLPLGIKFTLDGIYSKTLNNVFFENLAITSNENIYAVPGVAASATPYYNIESSAYYSIVNLKNTSKGYTYAVSAMLEKDFDFGLNVAASYTFGHAKSVNDGTSSVAYSNWKYNYSHDTNGKGELGYSKFDVPHRIMARLTYNSKRYLGGLFSTNLGITYNATSGQRYCLTMYENDDFNGDGYRGNNLLYIPTKMELGAMQFEDTYVNGVLKMDADENRAAFERWIESDSYAKNHRGQYAERNSNLTDWEHEVNLHFGQAIHLKNYVKAEFTLDIINFANCLNKKWGAQYGSVYNYSPLYLSSITTVNGQKVPVFQYNETTLTKSDIYSRWHMQLGFRLTF